MIQRYEVDGIADRDALGDYVLFADHEAEVKRLREALELCEHKIDQHLQGQYKDNPLHLGGALANARAALKGTQ